MAEHALTLMNDPEQRKRVESYAAGVKVLRRMDEALLPKEDPRRLVQQLHVAAFSGSAAESASPLFVEEASPGDAGVALESIRTRFASMIRTALKTNKTSERMADVASVLELKSDGDADGGYRLNAENMRWYVVKRNGELRLLPPGLQFAELGREALRRLEAGDADGARRWLEWAAVELRPLADDPAGKADPIIFNELAWNALFRDEPPTDAVLENAVKANARTNYRIPNYLHTLATVHAERGQAVEARKFLMQAIDARDAKTVNEDLYVLGRIAECYGLNEAAARHYAQVEPDDAANSTYHLAQRRLKRLPEQH